MRIPVKLNADSAHREQPAFACCLLPGHGTGEASRAEALSPSDNRCDDRFAPSVYGGRTTVRRVGWWHDRRMLHRSGRVAEMKAAQWQRPVPVATLVPATVHHPCHRTSTRTDSRTVRHPVARRHTPSEETDRRPCDLVQPSRQPSSPLRLRHVPPNKAPGPGSGAHADQAVASCPDMPRLDSTLGVLRGAQCPSGR